MDEINTILIDLLSSEDKDCSYVYPILSNLKLNDEQLKNLEIIPKLYLLYDKGILRKDLVLFSLLVNADRRYFEELIKFEKAVLQLNLEDGTTLFDFSYEKKKNWFLELIENDFGNLRSVFTEETLQRINVIKLIYNTHLEAIDLGKIKSILGETNFKSHDAILGTFLSETEHNLRIIEYCLETNPEGALNVSELFHFVWNNNILSVLSKYVKLHKLEYWDDIKQLIKTHEDFLNTTYPNQTDVIASSYTETETFFVYTILHNVIKSIKLCHNLNPNDYQTKTNISSIIEKTKQLIIQIKKDDLLIDTLENIFVLIFMRDDSGFFCNQNELFLNILFLKSLINEIKTTRKFEKNSDIYKRFHELSDYVTDALWRLELITSIEKCDGDFSKKSILTYMLASPESLINICLKKENFEKAHQVIKVS